MDTALNINQAPTAIEQLADMKISYTRIGRPKDKTFPFSSDYLDRVLSEGKVSKAEELQILASHPREGGLFALLAYGLIRRAIAKKQMSPRYHVFLEKTAELIKTGKIKFKPSNAFLVDSVDALYDAKNQCMEFSPKKIKQINNIPLTESTIIHELWHNWQNHNQRTLPYSLYEVEAIFAQADFLYRTEPDSLGEHWLNVSTSFDKSTLRYKFFPPKSAIARSTTLSHDSPFYQSLLHQARECYLWTRVTIGSKSDTIIQNLLSQTMPVYTSNGGIQSVPDSALVGLADLAEKHKNILQQKPLREHFSCSKTKTSGESILASCKPSKELIEFSSIIHAFALCSLTRNKKATEMVANRYAIAIWTESPELAQKHSLVDFSEIDLNIEPGK